eukprot:Rmarinus@m.2430
MPRLFVSGKRQVEHLQDFGQSDSIALRDFREARGRSLENLRAEAISAASIAYVRETVRFPTLHKRLQSMRVINTPLIQSKSNAAPWSSDSLVRPVRHDGSRPTPFEALGRPGVQLRQRQIRKAELAEYENTHHRQTILLSILILILFVHPTVTSATVQSFQCLSIPTADGDMGNFLKQDVDIECYTPEHAQAVPVGLVAFVVYIIGIPAFCAWLLVKYRSNLYTPSSLSQVCSPSLKTTCFAVPPRIPGLAVGRSDGSVEVHPVVSPRLKRLIETIVVGCPVTSLCFTNMRRKHLDLPNSSTSIPSDTRFPVLLVGRQDGIINVYTVFTKSPIELVCSLVGHAGPVAKVVAAEDGSVVATAALDGTVKLWDLSSGRCTQTLPAHPSTPLVALNSSGSILAYLLAGHQVRIINLRTDESKILPRFGNTEVCSLAVSRTGTRFAVGCTSGFTRVFSTFGFAQLGCLVGLRGKCDGLAFVPGLRGDALAFCGFRMLGVWEYGRDLVFRKCNLRSAPLGFACDGDAVLYHAMLEDGEVVQWSPFKEHWTSRVRRYSLERVIGFLYFCYKPEYHWWEFVIIIRKTLIVMLAMVANDRFLTGLRIVGIMLFAVVAQIVCQPFSRCIYNNSWSRFSQAKAGKTILMQHVLKNTLNDMEVASLTATLFNLLIGLYFQICDDSVVYLLLGCTFALNAYIMYFFAVSVFEISMTALKYRYIPRTVQALLGPAALEQFLAWRSRHDDDDIPGLETDDSSFMSSMQRKSTAGRSLVGETASCPPQSMMNPLWKSSRANPLFEDVSVISLSKQLVPEKPKSLLHPTLDSSNVASKRSNRGRTSPASTVV